MKKQINKGDKKMKYKHIVILTLFITALLLCSLSTISAANQTINDTSTGGIAQGITNTGPNDTLFLEEGTYNKTGEDTNIAINKNITIQGKGPKDKVIIDARGLSRIFTINNNLNVTFINLTFINALVTGDGGAVYNANAGTTMTFINCVFTNNTVTNSSNTNGRGGAIYNTGSNLNIINSTFTNNTAINGGGAVYNRGAGSNFTISNNNFTSNTALRNGGAIEFYVSSNVTIVNNNFINNGPNGAIYTDGVTYIISNNNFTNNSVGLRNNAHNVTITYNNFINNTGSGVRTTASNITITYNNFINNTAASGGAIRLEVYNNTVISNNNFIGNTATASGGGIDIYGSYVNLTISNNNFTNNTATDGGAIRNTNEMNFETFIINNNFIGNTATNRGGAIYNIGNVTINNNVMKNNTANYGGGIFNYINAMCVSGNTMIGNSASLGQMIYNNGTMGILKLTYLSNSTVKTTKGSNVVIYAILTDDMGNTVTGQDISFYVDGVFIANVTSIEGNASTTYLVTKGYASVLPVTGDYAGHGEYSIVTLNGALLIPKIPTNKTIDVAKNLKVGKKTTFESRLTDKDGNPIANATIDFYINGKKVGSAITDSNGIAKLDHTFTKAGSYNVQAKYAGNATYEASSATGQTTVSKTKTNLKLIVKGDKITAILTDEDGNPLAGKKIVFRVKGIVIGVGTTDANGVATIFYKNAERYTVTASFEGDDNNTSSSATHYPTTLNSTEENPNALASGKVAMKETGLPIVAILLALFASIGLLGYRKRN